MRTYLAEVDFPGVGTLQPDELETVARRAQRNLADLAAQVRWQHAYLASDRGYVVYDADDEAVVREHLARIGLPATRVSRINAVIDSGIAFPTEDRPKG